MTSALSWSGGKDSTLALDRALEMGLPVRYLFNIYDGRTGRVRFHGVRRGLIVEQARALDLELIQRATDPRGFEAAFLSILDDLAERGVEQVLFGNIHLEDIRGWYEQRTIARGFQHREPLWGEAPKDLVLEFVRRRHRALIVSLDQEIAIRTWLGRELSEELVAEIVQQESVDPCGEHGEYHTFVFAGPLFSADLQVSAGAMREEEGHLLLDLTLSPPT